MRTSKRRILAEVIVLVMAAITIIGCSPTEEPRGFWGKLWRLEVGPDYQRPKVMPAVEFRSQLGPSEAASVADLPWWRIFNDKILQDLIATALAQNYDLHLATARVQQARAMVGVAASQLYPQIGYQAFAGREKAFVPTEETGGNITFNAFSGLFDVVWEIDVWGRIRRSTEAARADLYAQEYVRRGVMLTLVSDVAADYFGLLELDQELAIARNSSLTYKQTLDLFTQRFEFGRDSRLPVERAQAAYDSSIARINSLSRAIAQQENAISVLLGDYPKDVPRDNLGIEQLPPQTPVGLTSDLIIHRPDIIEAEQHMVSANAQVGVAVANFFPRIGLSALYGGQSPKIGDIFDNSFSIWNIFGGLTGPVFQGGQLLETYHAQQAFWDASIAQYKQTILIAFQEVSDALIAQETLIPQREAIENQVTALQDSVDLSLLRYQAGRASYFEVLEAEELLFPAEDSLAQTRRDQLLAIVDLYKALGGGWNLSETDWQRPH